MESSESLTETGRLKILAEQRMLKDLAETWRPALEFIGRLRTEIKRWSG